MNLSFFSEEEKTDQLISKEILLTQQYEMLDQNWFVYYDHLMHENRTLQESNDEQSHKMPIHQRNHL